VTRHTNTRPGASPRPGRVGINEVTGRPAHPLPPEEDASSGVWPRQSGAVVPGGPQALAPSWRAGCAGATLNHLRPLFSRAPGSQAHQISQGPL